MTQRLLVGNKTSALIDAQAAADWGFNEYALVEAAGRNCARNFEKKFPCFFDGRVFRIAAAAGTGNNGADALVMLRHWLLSNKVLPSSLAVVISRFPTTKEPGPCSTLLGSLQKMKVPVISWDERAKAAQNALGRADLVIDGIAGTGIKGPLAGNSEKMVRFLNSLKEKQNKAPFVVSVDLPSGNSDEWKPDMPIMKADAVLSIEPQKYCLYNPPARIFAGTIIPVGGIFPSALLHAFKGAELLDWNYAKNFISPVKPDAYKHERGLVEIRAGAVGTTGAAVLAARGAQACGAGLVRLVVDGDIYPILASGIGGSFPGIMVYPASQSSRAGASTPDAVLLGPGWGRQENRKAVFEKALEQEKKGTPLILDADALVLAADRVFHNHCILTPHPGEFAGLSGASMDEVLSQPVPLLLKTAKDKKAVIILKGHVINIASPDGRWGIIDGMVPNLASGGSGDLLAGFCAALAARTHASLRGAGQSAFDGYACASAAAALLIEAGKSEETGLSFTDPLEIAEKASGLAGRCWLGEHGFPRERM